MKPDSFLILIAFVALLPVSCKHRDSTPGSKLHDDPVANLHGHQHFDSPGGHMLSGYPWGVFDLQTQFTNRLTHKKNDQELSLSNKIFESLAGVESNELKVAFPVALEHQSYNPFGDGQSNGHADFSEWSHEAPPYIGLLFPDSSTDNLVILVHKEIEFGSTATLDWKNPGERSIVINATAMGGQLPKPLRDSYSKAFKVNVSIDGLGWGKLSGGKFAFFRPAGWQDWFAIHFQNPYVTLDTLTSDLPDAYKKFSTSNGELSVPNPMNGDSSQSNPPLVQFMGGAAQNDYLVFPADKVHSLYPKPDTPETIEKTVGGNWTFLLKPDKWESSSPDTFKQLYSCFPGRMYWEESMKKAISGTSWHHVGDPGEFLLNSVTDEKRSLVTALGVNIPETELPSGNLAFGLSHVGYSGLLKPGHAFISVKGQFHWHPVHTVEPICIEVWRPFCDVSESNSFGMNCS